MTRKDFIAIAATLKASKPFAGAVGNSKPIHAQWAHTTRLFADMCAAQSPNFQRDRFLLACGLSQAEVSDFC